MRPPRVLLLEAAGPESGALAATAVASGYQVYAATDPTTGATYGANLRALLAGCLLIDLAYPGQALGEVVDYAGRIGADAVLTTNEYLTDLLAKACATLGLPGNDPNHSIAARDKVAMSEAFEAHGVAAPETHVIDDEGELHDLLSAGQVPQPGVLKPAASAGSAGVTVIHRPEDVLDAWRAAREVRGMYGAPPDRRVLVQSYVDGTEYSVESLTQDGKTRHLCATTKIVTPGAHRVEVGHSLPATLPRDLELAVHEQVERAITAAGIRNGASHTEVIVGPSGGCTVIELAARIGAGHIGFLIQHALGVDPWKGLLDIALGRPVNLTPTRQQHAAVRFLTSPHAGLLVAVHGLPQQGPHVPAAQLRKAIGDTVEEPRANGGRLGHLIVTGPDNATVQHRMERLLAQITIEVTPAREPSPAGAGQ